MEPGSPELSVSIGVAFSERGYTDSLFFKADQALYAAKADGGKCYRIAEG